MIRLIFTALILFFTATASLAQKKNPLQINLNQQKGTYVTFAAGAQVWARFTELNPGSTINGAPESTSLDISLRRVRFGVYGKLTPRLKFNLSFGENNFNHMTGKDKGIRILNAYMEYQLADFISIGGGKSAWNGLSRYAVPSTFNATGVDIAVFAMPTVQKSDHLLRKMSVFAHGQVGPLDYRVVVAKPFIIENMNLTEGYADFYNGNPRIQTSAYVKYQFLDREGSRSPFSPGNWLGTKTIFNVGAGFMHQPDAMAYEDASPELQLTAMTHFAGDLFAEVPIPGKHAGSITLYSSYTRYNFGPGYLRNIGVNNSANGVDETFTFNGAGNAFPAIGTGNVFYVQSAYTFPARLNADQQRTRYQLYASWQHADYERLGGRMNLYEAGFSFIIDRHSKVTLGYQNRPIFDNLSGPIPLEVDRKGMAVLQYQVKF